MNIARKDCENPLYILKMYHILIMYYIAMEVIPFLW